jgi:hypothetical protein
VGTVITPGYIVSVMRLNAFMMSGRIGDARLAPLRTVIVIFT